MKIFFAVILLHVFFTTSAILGENLSTEEKITFKLEDEKTKLRYICNTPVYSLALLSVFKGEAAGSSIDYSFTSERITAGRVNLSGFWKEMLNPFGFGAASSVISEDDGMVKDFDLDSGGKYGGYIIFPKNIKSVFLLSSNPWVGVSDNIFISDIFKISLYSSLSSKAVFSPNEWILDHIALTESETLHAGVRGELIFPFFDLDILFLRSGNRYFRSGNFLRIFSNITTKLFDCRIRLAGSDRDYTIPPGKNPKEMLTFSSLVSFSPLSTITLPLEYEYRINHPAAFPSANLGTSIKGKGSVKYVGKNIKASLGGEVKKKQEISGVGEDTYLLEGLVKYFTDSFDFAFSGGEKGNRDGPCFRWGELYFNLEVQQISGSLHLRLTADTSNGKKITLEEKYNLRLNFDSGTLDISCFFDPKETDFKYKSRVPPDHFSIAWNQRIFR